MSPFEIFFTFGFVSTVAVALQKFELYPTSFMGGASTSFTGGYRSAERSKALPPVSFAASGGLATPGALSGETPPTHCLLLVQF